MTRTTFATVAAAVLLGAMAGNTRAADTICVERGHAMLTALQAGHYDTATEHFDTTMHAQLTPAMLQQAWRAMAQKFGPAHPSSSAGVAHKGAYVVVNIPLGYKDQPLAAEVACDANNAIAGFHIAPQTKP